MSNDALSVARRYCEAWQTNDLAGIIDCYADDFVLHYFGDNPYSGDHIGKDAALATLLAVSAKAPRQLIEVEEILASADGALVVARERLTVADVDHEIRRALRYRVSEGRFTECWLYEEDQALIDRAWS